MRRRLRHASYRYWKCEGCGAKYETPIPALSVTCPSPIRKHDGRVVQMKPDKEKEEANAKPLATCGR